MALPPADLLRAYYSALNTRDVDGAVALFHLDALLALPNGADIETGPRVVSRGQRAVREQLMARATTFVHRPSVIAVDGDIVLAEGVLTDPVDGAPLASYMSSAWIVSRPVDGRTERALASLLGFQGGPFTPPHRRAARTRADARVVVDQYFHALETGRFDDAVQCFSDDVVYAHPPYRHTGITEQSRVCFTGRDELLAAFRRRGVQSFRHDITAFADDGDVVLFEGRVVDLPDGGAGAFVSSATFDADGRIARYVSFYCEPAPW